MTVQGGVTKGEYRYVDPLGNQVTVRYSYDENVGGGYTEKRRIDTKLRTGSLSPVLSPATRVDVNEIATEITLDFRRRVPGLIMEAINTFQGERIDR
jgi:hypothetical protein